MRVVAAVGVSVVMAAAWAVHVGLVLALDRDAQWFAAHGRGLFGGGLVGMGVTVVMWVIVSAAWAVFMTVFMAVPTMPM